MEKEIKRRKGQEEVEVGGLSYLDILDIGILLGSVTFIILLFVYPDNIFIDGLKVLWSWIK